jgi:hypothetical protein
MLIPPSALASEQAAPTEATMEICLQFLDYAASQEDAILTYKPATWYWQSIVMPPICPNQKLAAKPEDTCSWQEKRKSQPTMEWYSTYCKS